MVFYAAFNSISVISQRQLTLFMSFLGSEVSCPRTLPRKNPEDQVRLEPRTPGLQVKHFTTEPRRTCDFVKVKDEVSKTKIACRHCQTVLKYTRNISNFNDHLTRKHFAVSLSKPFPLFFFFIISFSPNVFSPPHKKFVFFILLSANAFNLDQFEIYCVVKTTSIFACC